MTLWCSSIYRQVASKLPDHRLVQLAPSRIVDGFEARLRELQLRLLQRAAEPFVFARDPLGLDEQAQALVEGEGGGVGVLLLVGPRGGQRVELERVEFLERGRIEHRRSFTGSRPGHGDATTSALQRYLSARSPNDG